MHITKDLEDRVQEMFKVLETRIPIPDSPIKLRVGHEFSECHIKTNVKYKMLQQHVYCQLGGRGLLHGEIVNAGNITQPEAD